MAARNCRIIVHSPPDSHGRQRFTLEWKDLRGPYRHEKSADGYPVGRRRGQCFNAVVADYTKRMRNCRVSYVPRVGCDAPSKRKRR